MESSFQHLSVHYFLAFEMKRFGCERGFFRKVVTHNLCQNANFKNGSTTFQIDILQLLLNILSISLLSKKHDMSGYFKMQ